MAVSDLWRRTLVYFGMADEADDYDDEARRRPLRRGAGAAQLGLSREDLGQATASAPTSAASARAY